MSGSKTITGIMLSNQQLTNDKPSGTEVGIITVTMSDGTKFDGTLSLSGPYAATFSINAVRDPYQISSVALSNASVLSGQPSGTVIGAISVAMSDGSAFSGSLRVNDTTHFAISGSNLVTAASLTAGSLPVQITASQTGLADYAQSFNISVQQASQPPPGPPTNLAVVSKTTTSVTLSFAAPTSGTALDSGGYHVEYKASASGVWLPGPILPYVTLSSGSITDGYGNVWDVRATGGGNPNALFVNGVYCDAWNLGTALLVGAVMYHVNIGGQWYSYTIPGGSVIGSDVRWTATTAAPLSAITVGSLSQATSYDFRVWVSNTNGNSNPSAVVSVITDTVVQTGNGPPASSTFITADYTSAFNYPAGYSQQIISRQMYGVGSSSLVNNNFWAFQDTGIQNNLGAINPGLYMLKNGGFGYWNSDLTVNTGALANLVNNFHKLDPLGVAGVWFSIDRSMVPSYTPQRCGTAVGNLASYLFNYTMANGRKFPIWGFSGEDEPEGRTDEATIAAQTNAMVSPVKAVSSNLLIGGPQCSFLAWTDFGTQVSALDFFVYNCFNEGSQSGGFPIAWDDVTTGVTNMLSRYASDADGAAGATGNLKAVAMAGYGMDWDCAVDAMNSHVGAVFVASVYVTLLNHAKLPQWPCLWGGWGNGTAGVVTDPYNQANAFYGVTNTMQITPKGYFMAYGIRNLYGPRWQVPTNAPGLMAVACSPGTGRASLLLINAGRGNRSGTVALSHCPVGTNINSSGNGTANVWQMTASQSRPGTDGTRSTIAVTAGVTGSLTLPDPSITIIST